MTVPTSEDPYPPQVDQQDPPPPFDDQATFQIDKPFGLAQLIDEIAAKLKIEVNVAQLGPDDPAQAISPDNPATLAISPGSVDKTKVQQAIDAHEPTEGYDVPAYEKAFSELMTKVVNDPDTDLSELDVAVAVRGLLLRENRREASAL